MGNVKCIAVIECYWTIARKTTVCHFPASHESRFSLMSGRDEAQTREWRFLSRTERSEQTCESVSTSPQRDAEDHSASVPLNTSDELTLF